MERRGTNRVEDRGSYAPFLESERAEQTRHASANDGDVGVIGNGSVEDELLLGEALLDGGLSRRSSPIVLGAFGLAAAGGLNCISPAIVVFEYWSEDWG